MTKSHDVAGLGNAIVDVIAAVDDRFLRSHKIAKGTMTLIDEFRAQELHKALADARQALSFVHEVAGGSCANTMAGLASLGGRCVYAGKIHDDRLGQVFAASMRELGVTFTTTPATSGAPTASSMIAVTPDGQRSMNTYLGACREMVPDDVDAAQIADAAILYIEGYLWDEENAKQASRKAMEAARKAGGQVALTLSDPFCVGRFRGEFQDLLLNNLDIVFANEEEAKALFEEDDFARAVDHLRRWGGIAALTRSAKGCVIVHGNDVHEVPAAPVAQVIDTTGAGDQFAAGFLFGLTRGKSLEACGRLGVMAAGEVISHYGARPQVSLRELAANQNLL